MLKTGRIKILKYRGIVLSFLLVNLALLCKEGPQIKFLHYHERINRLFRVRKSEENQLFLLFLLIHNLKLLCNITLRVPIFEFLLHNFLAFRCKLRRLDLQSFLNRHGFNDLLYF